MIGVGDASISPRGSPAGDRKYTLPLAPAGDDLAVRRDRDGIERRRQRHDGGAAAVERPDAQRRVVAGADQRLAVRRERDAVDVLRMAFEHARRAARRAATAGRCDPTTPRRAVVPSGETARPTIGAVCPSSTVVGLRLCPASRSRCARPRRR